MTAYKLLTIFVVLLLTQFAYSKPAYDDNNSSLDSSEEEIKKNLTPTQKLLLYTFDNFVVLSAKRAANVSRYILKDEALMANTKPEVMQFKKNLTEFVAKYETNKSKDLTWDALDIYINATDYYLDMPAEKLTTDGKFILEILNKYDCKAVLASFGLEFIEFMKNLEKMFEENKSTVDTTILEWLEKYNSLTDFEEKIDAISDFLKMVCSAKPISDYVTPSRQFVKFTLNGFQQLSINYVTKAKKINEYLLKDSEIVNSKSAKVVEFKNNLIKFEEKYALLAKDSAVLFELVDLYKNSTSYYYKTNETLLDPEENLIFNRLQKYGSNEMNADTLKLFNEFVAAFCEKFDTLQQNFKKDDDKLGKNILDWSRHSYAVLKAKDKSSYDEKSAAFEKFFQIIKNEQK